MSLSRFILTNMENILAEWQSFAETVSSSRGLDRAELRDDAQGILTTIAHDMEVSQSNVEQEAKSQGNREQVAGAPETSATAHGVQRFAAGFNSQEMVSEYRALRASVIRLWIRSAPATHAGVIYELIRFNEGIDQALNESVRLFSEQLDRSRELFMGVLGHDLRTPLHVIQNSTDKLLRRTVTEEQRRELGGYIRDSTQHITGMVNDLLDVASTRLGGVLPIASKPMDAVPLCQDVLEQFRILHPDREIEFTHSGDLHGVWDSARIHQVLTNLIRNALQHGDSASPVRMTAQGEPDRVCLGVHNKGTPIPAGLISQIFEPMIRGDAQQGSDAHRSMGLGLYIAQTIIHAHHGTLAVESSREGARGSLPVFLGT
jgi:signal transduction histidine kinase